MRSFVLVAVLVAAVFTAAAGTASATTVAVSPPLDASPGPGSVGVRLLDVPADAQSDPRAQQYIVDRLAPGTVIHRRIQVSNSTPGPIRVQVYPAAATIQDGTFTGAAGHTANDLSSWTTLDQGVVTIASGAQAVDTITVAVPTDAAPGEQYAAVWVQTSSSTASAVTLVNRVGVRLYVSVGAGNAPASSFTVETLTAQRAPDGHPVVTAQVHNTGGRALDMSGSLALSQGPGALSAGPFPVQVTSTLAPGQSGPVTVSLDQQLPDGPWTARMTLTSGLLSNHYDARIQFPAHSGSAAPVAPDSAGPFPLAVLIGALLVILLAAAVVIVVRRRAGRSGNHRSVRSATVPIPVPGPPGSGARR